MPNVSILRFKVIPTLTMSVTSSTLGASVGFSSLLASIASASASVSLAANSESFLARAARKYSSNVARKSLSWETNEHENYLVRQRQLFCTKLTLPSLLPPINSLHCLTAIYEFIFFILSGIVQLFAANFCLFHTNL